MPQNTSRGYTYPLYSDPTDFPAQIQELATDIDLDMDSLFDRIIAAKNQPACSISGSVVLPVPSATTVTSTYDTELYDNDAMVNLGVSNTTVTFTETGIYIATARNSFASNGNSLGRQISFVTTGILGTVARKTIQGETGISVAINLTAVFFATSGDTMTVTNRQNSGASVDLVTRRLQVAKVSAL